jgi:hypothetical protein
MDVGPGGLDPTRLIYGVLLVHRIGELGVAVMLKPFLR